MRMIDEVSQSSTRPEFAISSAGDRGLLPLPSRGAVTVVAAGFADSAGLGHDDCHLQEVIRGTTGCVIRTRDC